MVCDRADGQVIGQSGLRFVDEVGETEILYAYSRSSWGRGLATEAGRATLDFGFEQTPLQRIVAYAVPDNTASTRVMEKLGMTDEGTDRLWDMDLVRYTIGRTDWEVASP